MAALARLGVRDGHYPPDRWRVLGVLRSVETKQKSLTQKRKANDDRFLAALRAILELSAVVFEIDSTQNVVHQERE